jgi:hypothetical protein
MRLKFENLPREISSSSKGAYRKFLLAKLGESPRRAKSAVYVAAYEESGFLSRDLKMLRSSRWWKRFEAVSALDRVGTEPALSAIRECMDDPHVEVSRLASRAIVKRFESAGN